MAFVLSGTNFGTVCFSVALINTLLKEFGGVKDLFGLQVIN